MVTRFDQQNQAIERDKVRVLNSIDESLKKLLDVLSQIVLEKSE